MTARVAPRASLRETLSKQGARECPPWTPARLPGDSDCQQAAGRLGSARVRRLCRVIMVRLVDGLEPTSRSRLIIKPAALLLTREGRLVTYRPLVWHGAMAHACMPVGLAIDLQCCQCTIMMAH